MLEKGLIEMETAKTCAMSQIKTYVKIIQVTNPLDLHTSLNSWTLCLLAFLYITMKALIRDLNVPFKAIVFIFRYFFKHRL